MFLHNLRVLNVNLPDNVLFLKTFTFKLAKHKMATKMLRKPHIFYSLSQINAQFVFFARFLNVIFFLCLWKEITFIWPLDPRHPPFFMYLQLL